MFRKLLKLAVFLLIANGVYQVAPPVVHHFQFKDAVHDMALFAGNRQPDAELVEKVMELAAENSIPLEREYVQVQRQTGSMTVKATYVETMHLLPGFAYPWEFNLNITVLK
jgi:hypothetical protein